MKNKRRKIRVQNGLQTNITILLVNNVHKLLHCLFEFHTNIYLYTSHKIREQLNKIEGNNKTLDFFYCSEKGKIL